MGVANLEFRVSPIIYPIRPWPKRANGLLYRPSYTARRISCECAWRRRNSSTPTHKKQPIPTHPCLRRRNSPALSAYLLEFTPRIITSICVPVEQEGRDTAAPYSASHQYLRVGFRHATTNPGGAGVLESHRKPERPLYSKCSEVAPGAPLLTI